VVSAAIPPSTTPEKSSFRPSIPATWMWSPATAACANAGNSGSPGTVIPRPTRHARPPTTASTIEHGRLPCGQSALAVRATSDADRRSSDEPPAQPCTRHAQPPSICTGSRSARAVTPSASTVACTRPSTPRAGTTGAGNCLQRGSWVSWTAIGTRSRSRRRRTPTRRVEASWRRAPSGAASSAGCACSATRRHASAGFARTRRRPFPLRLR
jgi:hypothetical protein